MLKAYRIMNHTPLTFFSILADAMIDIYEYKIIEKAKNAKNLLWLDKSYTWALHQEREHARQHQIIYRQLKRDFGDFKAFRALVEKRIATISEVQFWKVVAYLEVKNSMLVPMVFRHLKREDLAAMSDYQKKVIWHLLEEGEHAWVFFEFFEKSFGRLSVKRDVFQVLISFFAITWIFTAQLLRMKPGLFLKILWGSIAYQVFTVRMYLKLAFSDIDTLMRENSKLAKDLLAELRPDLEKALV